MCNNNLNFHYFQNKLSLPQQLAAVSLCTQCLSLSCKQEEHQGDPGQAGGHHQGEGDEWQVTVDAQ